MNQKTLSGKHKNITSTSPNIKNFLHDLSNPLTLVQLNLDVLYSKLNTDEKKYYSNLIEGALTGIEQANRMVVNIRKRMFDSYTITNEVKKVLNMYKQKMTVENISLLSNFKDDYILNSNKEKLIRILINVISNSIDELLTINKKRFIQITTYKEKAWFILQIDDNGKGIDPALLEILFYSGFSTKENGNGLGLNIVSHYMESVFNGKVECLSKKNKGTSFKLYFPNYTTNEKM